MNRTSIPFSFRGHHLFLFILFGEGSFAIGGLCCYCGLGILRREYGFNELLDLEITSARRSDNLYHLAKTNFSTRNTDLEKVRISRSVLFMYLPRVHLEDIADQS